MRQVVAPTCTVWTKRRSSLDVTFYFDSSSAAESGSISQMLARMPLISLIIDGIHIAEILKTSNRLCLDPDPEGRDGYISYDTATAQLCNVFFCTVLEFQSIISFTDLHDAV